MFWKKGIEYRGVDPAGGVRTRWEVASATLRVTVSRPIRLVGPLSCQPASENALTFTDIDNESARDGWGVDPFTSKVLYLQAGMVGCLKKLLDGLVTAINKWTCITEHART